MKYFPSFPEKIFLTSLLVLISTFAMAQTTVLDSLYQVLNTYQNKDVQRVNTLLQVCDYEFDSQPEKCKVHVDEARQISEAIQYHRGVSQSMRYLSLYYEMKAEFARCADVAFAMRKYCEDPHDAEGLAYAYGLIG